MGAHKRHENLDKVAAARSQADVYGFLATLLNECPDAALVGNLRAAGGDFIRSLAEEANLTGEVAQGFRDMAKYVEESQSQPEQAVQQDLAVDWTRLFRGLSPTYSPMPPYEASFVETNGTPIQVIQEVNQLYRVNGLAMSSEYSDRPDYMGVELSFLQHLSEAEARAWKENKPELARSHQKTAQEFLNGHLGIWADKFITPAMDFARTGFYHGFLQLCRGVVAESLN
jgi:putative dimethyl sulfoxide reductase chaperone